MAEIRTKANIVENNKRQEDVEDLVHLRSESHIKKERLSTSHCRHSDFSKFSLILHKTSSG